MCIDCLETVPRRGNRQYRCEECAGKKAAAIQSASGRQWAKDNRSRLNSRMRGWSNDRRRESARLRLNHTVFERIRYAIKNGRKGAWWGPLLPYTVEELKRHLERQFSAEMTWGSWGRTWQIDHIVPLASFEYASAEDDEFKAAWALSNIRPIVPLDNLKKHAKRLYLI